MSVLDTWVLKYKTDVEQAIKDIERLEKEQDKVTKGQERANKAHEQGSKTVKQTAQVGVNEGKKIVDAVRNMRGGIGEMMGSVRTVTSAAGEAIGGVGVAAGAAGMAVGAAVAVLAKGLSDVSPTIDRAIAQANKAREAFAGALSASVSTGEMIRMQDAGRLRGARDQDISASVSGVNERVLAFAAARREAARNPASSFNNPVLKAQGLWEAAGVHTTDKKGNLRNTADIMADQDKYLRALKERGEQERALVEGVKLFGRNVEDVRTVLSSTNEEFKNSQLELAKENNQRRELQAQSESLATANAKLEAAQKATDEHLTSMSMPAVRDYTEAMEKWTRAIRPLKEGWQEFVDDLLKSLTWIIKKSTWLLNLGNGETNDSREEAIKKAGDTAAQQESQAIRRENVERKKQGLGEISKEEIESRRENARKKAEDAQRNTYKTAHEKRMENFPSMADAAIENLRKSGALKGYSEKQIAQARSKAESIAREDMNVTDVSGVEALLKDQLSVQKETGTTLRETNKLAAKTEVNTRPAVNLGMEQALSLWAGSMGQGKLSVKAGMENETLAGWGQRAYHNIMTTNPNTFQHMQLRGANAGPQAGARAGVQVGRGTPMGLWAPHRAAIAAAGAQGATVAAYANRQAVGAVGAPQQVAPNVTIGKIEVNTQAKTFEDATTDMQEHLRSSLSDAVGAFSSPTVS